MKIDIAINELEGIKREYPPKLFQVKKNALNLGIEALKEIKSIRECYPITPWKTLPGETEE